MKKSAILLTLALVAGGTAQALTVFQDDFSTSTSTNTSVFGARIGDGDGATGALGNWYSGPNFVTTGELSIKGASSAATSSTQPRAGVIVLDGSSLNAGEYTLSWNYNMWNNVHMDVQVWSVQQTAGDNTSYYTVKYADNGVLSNAVVTAGDATANFIGGLTFLNTTGGIFDGSTNITFNYDGTGDIALMFGATANINWTQPTTKFDNISLVIQLPTPSVRLLILDK